MKTFGAFLRAFRKPYSYDFRRNSYLWLGVFWGLLIPSFAVGRTQTVLWYVQKFIHEEQIPGLHLSVAVGIVEDGGVRA